MKKIRYQLVLAKDLTELQQNVDYILNDKPVYEPCGGPIHDIDGTPGGTWYQAVYCKETE